jgi:hypothetical protein
MSLPATDRHDSLQYFFPSLPKIKIKKKGITTDENRSTGFFPVCNRALFWWYHQLEREYPANRLITQQGCAELEPHSGTLEWAVPIGTDTKPGGNPSRRNDSSARNIFTSGKNHQIHSKLPPNRILNFVFLFSEKAQ